MNLVLVISSLGSGGAERVLSGMASYWSEAGNDVTLLTYSNSDDFYPVSKGVKRIKLGLMHESKGIFDSIFYFLLRLYALRKAISSCKPDCVVSFIEKTNVLTLLACSFLGVRVVVSERTNPRAYFVRPLWDRLRALVYRFSDALVVQTESLRPWAASICRPNRVWVIPNAIDSSRLQAMTHLQDCNQSTSWTHRIVSMGRMTTEKGHDLLLEACAKIFSQHTDWGLEIVGDGPLREKLTKQAESLGISDRVHFHGQLSAPFGVVKRADIFVLPSRIEGFPNVLLEAMCLGRAVVSFDCESGPSEMIEHSVNGLLVKAEDVEELALAIKSLIIDPEKRRKLGASAIKVATQYNERTVMSKWDEVIRK